MVYRRSRGELDSVSDTLPPKKMKFETMKGLEAHTGSPASNPPCQLRPKHMCRDALGADCRHVLGFTAPSDAAVACRLIEEEGPHSTATALSTENLGIRAGEGSQRPWSLLCSPACAHCTRRDPGLCVGNPPRSCLIPKEESSSSAIRCSPRVKQEQRLLLNNPKACTLRQGLHQVFMAKSSL